MKEAQVSEVAPVEVAPAEEQQALAISHGGAVGQALPPEQIKPPVTAAQAKVDAVANLTMKAYERAGTLVLTKEEIAALQADFPDEAFKPGAAGKEKLIYIEHAFLRDRLNQVIGCGQWSIVPRSRWAEDFIIPAKRDSYGNMKPETQGVRIYVEAMLIVRGCFVAENIGDMDYYPKNAGTNYGDAVRGATTQALRRCAADLGIGLQAWKKDWCEGWWKRRTGKGDPARQQFQRATPPATAKPAATQAAAKPPPQKGPPIAHAGNRVWLINKITPAGRTAAEAYFQSIEPNPWLLPNEKLEDLCLRFVPATIPRAEALFQKIKLFAETGTAERPYEPDMRAQDGPPATPPPATPPPKTTAKAEAKEEPATKKRDPDWFWDIVCPIPHKGEKRDDYMSHPDTIRSLYAATKAGDEAAQKRLWGFANNWAPEARTVNGKTYQPTAQDHLFREALDAFLDWHERHGNDTEPEHKTIQDPPTGANPEDDEDNVPF